MNGHLFGEPIVGGSATPGAFNVSAEVVATPTGIYLDEGALAPDFVRTWEPQKGKTIKSLKRTTTPSGGEKFLVLLNDGTVIKLISRLLEVENEYGYLGGFSFFSQSWVEVTGDAIYVLSSSAVYVSRDSGATFSVDSAGLAGIGAYVWGIDIDSLQYVYAATTKGLFKQHPDSNKWNQVVSLGTLNLRRLFVDRRQRIFVSENGNPVSHVSTDGGLTWSLVDTAGLEGSGNLVFADDPLGNIYAIGIGIYRSSDGLHPWTRIGAGITTIAVNPISVRSINVFSGDSVIHVATSIGLFRSTDRGATWQLSNKGIKAQSFYGIAKTADGHFLESTALGIYSSRPPDTVWTKVYPASGYQGGLPIYNDGTGNLYTVLSNSPSDALAPVYKSTDGGATWFADTAGISKTTGTGYYVDENGTQYAYSTLYGSSWKSVIYRKTPGASYAPDTVGFPVFQYSFTYSMSSNKHGALYASGSYSNGGTTYPKVLKRPIGGGTWVPDTAGIPANIFYFNTLLPDKNGNMLGLAGSVLYHQESGTWVKKNVPAGISSISKISIDSSGALFVVRNEYVYPIGYRDVGVSVSTDNGATWNDLTHDTTTVQLLAAMGDTTYAVTLHGVTVLTRNGVVAGVIEQHSAGIPASYRLYQNYPNPFNPSTKILYELPRASYVRLSIYDVLGREVKVLVDAQIGAGQHQATFNAGNLSSGVYFYRLVAGTFMETRKLLLMK
ncbi:MAG TPA: T9SS type A sorting domain-containing protein [Bacteroidota bacterium]|nr:T9SS type A sorting domain-containing protein [Bacteroidota bacterium]